MLGRRHFLQLGAAAAATATPAGLFAQAAGTIATREIKSTGLIVGVVGFGNSPAFSNQTTTDHHQVFGSDRDRLIRELVGAFLNRGGNFVDASYGSVVSLAEILPNEDFNAIHFATSPFDVFGDHVPSREHVDALMAILNKSPLDILQIRNAWTSDTTKVYWPLMKEWKQEGLVRNIGTSGAGPEHADVMVEVMHDGADFVHLEYSLFSQQAENRVLPAAAETDTAVFVMRPFRSGELFSVTSGRELPEWASEFDCTSWGQFGLKWILGHPAVTSVFMETTRTRHVIDNMGAGMGRLPNANHRRQMLDLIQSWI